MPSSAPIDPEQVAVPDYWFCLRIVCCLRLGQHFAPAVPLFMPSATPAWSPFVVGTRRVSNTPTGFPLAARIWRFLLRFAVRQSRGRARVGARAPTHQGKRVTRVRGWRGGLSVFVARSDECCEREVGCRWTIADHGEKLLLPRAPNEYIILHIETTRL